MGDTEKYDVSQDSLLGITLTEPSGRICFEGETQTFCLWPVPVHFNISDLTFELEMSAIYFVIRSRFQAPDIICIIFKNII